MESFNRNICSSSVEVNEKNATTEKHVFLYSLYSNGTIFLTLHFMREQMLIDSSDKTLIEHYPCNRSIDAKIPNVLWPVDYYYWIACYSIRQVCKYQTHHHSLQHLCSPERIPIGLVYHHHPNDFQQVAPRNLDHPSHPSLVLGRGIVRLAIVPFFLFFFFGLFFFDTSFDLTASPSSIFPEVIFSSSFSVTQSGE
jgi:hypothetical protein